MLKTFIGLDYGSDSVRALLVDQNGRELAAAVHNYRRWSEGKFCDAVKHQFRQHPLDYLEGLETVIREVLKNQDASAVAGIAVDATCSTMCAVDGNGVPLALKPGFESDPDAMFVLWKDHTSIAEADEINALAHSWEVDYTKYSGGTYSCEWAWAKMFYFFTYAITTIYAFFLF